VRQFGGDIDYAMFNKIYGIAPESAKARYGPAERIGVKKERIEGNRDPALQSTRQSIESTNSN